MTKHSYTKQLNSLNPVKLIRIYAHLKPGGTSFWQALRIKLNATGTFKLIPSTLALMAVQRHKAASKSTNPLSKEQQGLVGGLPITTLTSPRISAHTPSFNASLGHDPVEGGGAGVAGGVGHVGVGLHELQALEIVERRIRERMKMAEERVLEAIGDTLTHTTIVDLVLVEV